MATWNMLLFFYCSFTKRRRAADVSNLMHNFRSSKINTTKFSDEWHKKNILLKNVHLTHGFVAWGRNEAQIHNVHVVKFKSE
jgi:hypothetical protein